MTHRNLFSIRTTCFAGVTVITSNTDLEMTSHLAAHIASSLLLNGGYLFLLYCGPMLSYLTFSRKRLPGYSNEEHFSLKGSPLQCYLQLNALYF